MADDCFADEKSREHTAFSPATEDERPIEPISDIGIDRINSLMYGDR
jgi:phosphatidylinositol N-acetylglucosaminyltransferase subunit P